MGNLSESEYQQKVEEIRDVIQEWNELTFQNFGKKLIKSFTNGLDIGARALTLLLGLFIAGSVGYWLYLQKTTNPLTVLKNLDIWGLTLALLLGLLVAGGVGYIFYSQKSEKLKQTVLLLGRTRQEKSQFESELLEKEEELKQLMNENKELEERINNPRLANGIPLDKNTNIDFLDDFSTKDLDFDDRLIFDNPDSDQIESSENGNF